MYSIALQQAVRCVSTAISVATLNFIRLVLENYDLLAWVSSSPHTNRFLAQIKSILGVWSYNRAVLNADRDLIGSIHQALERGEL